MACRLTENTEYYGGWKCKPSGQMHALGFLASFLVSSTAAISARPATVLGNFKCWKIISPAHFLHSNILPPFPIYKNLYYLCPVENTILVHFLIFVSNV
jgi:hypothetical protein